jgi:hypothetical protein
MPESRRMRLGCPLGRFFYGAPKARWPDFDIVVTQCPGEQSPMKARLPGSAVSFVRAKLQPGRWRCSIARRCVSARRLVLQHYLRIQITGATRRIPMVCLIVLGLFFSLTERSLLTDAPRQCWPVHTVCIPEGQGGQLLLCRPKPLINLVSPLGMSPAIYFKGLC